MVSDQTPLSVPVIDLSSPELKPGSPQWELAKSQVRKAAEEYGCFQVKVDRGTLDIEAPVFGSLEEFFALPMEIKKRIACEEYFRGYVGQVPDMPLFERIGIDDPTNLDKVESFTNVLWPQGNLSFSKTIQHCSKRLSEIDRLIRRMVVESFGVGKYMEDHLNSADYILRVTRYDKTETQKTTEKLFGLVSHTDKGMMTILCQNQVHGFELQTKDGRWIDVKPSSDSLIIVIGESYHVWTNGQFCAPHHRVMSSGNDVRYTIGLVAYPKLGCVLVKSPEELVDEAHPLLYRPLEFSELLKDHKIPVWENKDFAHCPPESDSSV